MTLTIQHLSNAYGKVAFQTAGEGDTVILLHGVGMRSEAWVPQVRSLSATHRVIALDLPGHGGSNALLAGAQLPDFVAWLHAALLALGAGPVSVAGHSMGALIAGGYAISHPEMVERVALLNGVYCRDKAACAAVISRAEDIHAGKFDFDAPLARWFGDSTVDQGVRAQVSGWLFGIEAEGYATAYGAFARGDATYAKRFNEITCPLLALTGDGDLNSSPAMAEVMAQTAQNGTSLILKGHRHMVNLTAPDLVNVALKTWLNTPTDGGKHG